MSDKKKNFFIELALLCIERKDYHDCHPEVGMGPSIEQCVDEVIERMPCEVDFMRDYYSLSFFDRGRLRGVLQQLVSFSSQKVCEPS